LSDTPHTHTPPLCRRAWVPRTALRQQRTVKLKPSDFSLSPKLWGRILSIVAASVEPNGVRGPSLVAADLAAAAATCRNLRLAAPVRS
jgi:hypothetical protein